MNPKIAYHFTIPRPPQPELDAAIQDALKLKNHFPGEINYLYPGREAKRYIPRFLCGWHQGAKLRALDRQVDIHQIYSNGLYPYPILKRFSKPIIYTLVTGLYGESPPLALFRFLLQSVHTFVTSNEADKNILNRWGFHNVEVVYPGLDLSRFSYTPFSPSSKFVLMAGSAPWNLAQFESKGVTLLLQALQQEKDLYLILLWRGVLLSEIRKRVQQAGVADRVEIIHQRVDVNQILKRVHASIVLAKSPALIKAYPHSLLESLAAGNPVMVSHGLPMADYVAKNHCGEVVEAIKLSPFLSSLKRLRQNYHQYQENCLSLDLTKFSLENLIDSYRNIYQQIQQ